LAAAVKKPASAVVASGLAVVRVGVVPGVAGRVGVGVGDGDGVAVVVTVSVGMPAPPGPGVSWRTIITTAVAVTSTARVIAAASAIHRRECGSDERCPVGKVLMLPGSP